MLPAVEAKRYEDLRANGWTRGRVDYAVGSGELHRVARGTLLAGAGLPSLVERLKALFLMLPRQAVVGFHTAAALYGFGVLPSPRPQILVPAGAQVPQIRGVATHQSLLPIGEPVDIEGLPCVPPPRCAIDLARTCRRLWSRMKPPIDGSTGRLLVVRAEVWQQQSPWRPSSPPLGSSTYSAAAGLHQVPAHRPSWGSGPPHPPWRPKAPPNAQPVHWP